MQLIVKISQGTRLTIEGTVYIVGGMSVANGPFDTHREIELELYGYDNPNNKIFIQFNKDHIALTRDQLSPLAVFLTN